MNDAKEESGDRQKHGEKLTMAGRNLKRDTSAEEPISHFTRIFSRKKRRIGMGVNYSLQGLRWRKEAQQEKAGNQRV